MKTIKNNIFLAVFIFFAAGLSQAVDIESVESDQIIDYLLGMPQPGTPEIIDGMVVFTASSGLRRVGVAFADESFAKVHWFRQFLIPRDPLEISEKEKREA
jgi:hypothetical protein